MAFEFNGTNINTFNFNGVNIENFYFNGVLVFGSVAPVDSNIPQLLPFTLYGIQSNQSNSYPYSNTIYLT